MKLKESVRIAAPPSAVWPHVADPLLQSEWNPRLIAIDRHNEGPVRAGESFRMIFRMSGRDRESRVEVSEAFFPERLQLIHRISDQGRERVVTESYALIPAEGGTRVEQLLDFQRAGIPAPLRILLQLIHRFGRHTETPFLENLRSRLEHPAA